MKKQIDAPAKIGFAIQHSSATHSPKKTKTIDKHDQEMHHQHKWIVISSHWECEICKMIFG